jgi:KUP system potassium uptake protein
VVNWILFSAVTVVVVVFKSSSALSSAYGIVVTGTMVLTACLLVIIARHKWRWPGFVTSLMLITMLAVDIPLFLANLGKLFSGGWIPVVLGLSMLAIMLIWYTERARLIHRLGNDPQRLQNLVNSLEESPPKRVKGTAIFLVRKPYEIPQSLLHNLKHNRVLHERVVFLHINTANAPRVANQQRLVIQKLSSSFWLATASYGWQETPAMPEILHLCGLEGLIMKLNDTSVFTAHDTLVMKKRAGLRKLRGGIFLFLQRNALRTHEQFMIPVDNVIELGGQKEF